MKYTRPIIILAALSLPLLLSVAGCGGSGSSSPGSPAASSLTVTPTGATLFAGAYSGTYNGVYHFTEGHTENTVGTFKATVDSSGKILGTATDQDVSLPVAGTVDPGGNAAFGFSTKGLIANFSGKLVAANGAVTASGTYTSVGGDGQGSGSFSGTRTSTGP